MFTCIHSISWGLNLRYEHWWRFFLFIFEVSKNALTCIPTIATHHEWRSSFSSVLCGLRWLPALLSLPELRTKSLPFSSQMPALLCSINSIEGRVGLLDSGSNLGSFYFHWWGIITQALSKKKRKVQKSVLPAAKGHLLNCWEPFCIHSSSMNVSGVIRICEQCERKQETRCSNRCKL